MRNLERVLDRFREAGGDDWRLRQIMLFLRIGSYGSDGVTLTELSEQLGLAAQVVERNCKALTFRGRVNPETGAKEYIGLGLIEYRKDFFHANRWNVRLTDSGTKLWNDIQEIMK